MKSITAGEIATNLNTSRNTVSKVLNSRGYVSEALRKKIVIEAVEKGYKNISDELMEYYRSLGDTSHSAVRTIVLIASAPEISPCLMQIVAGVSNEIGATQHRLVPYFMQMQDEAEFVLPPLFSQTEVDGVIVMGVSHPRVISVLAELPAAKVYLDLPLATVSDNRYCCQSVRGDVVMLESRISIPRIVDYFVKKKHCKTIGFAGSRSRFVSSEERYEAFRKGLAKSGTEFRQELCLEDMGNHSFFYDEDIAEGLRKLPFLPDAFVCENDRIAYGVLQKLKELFPEQAKTVYISGYNDMPPAGMAKAVLTSVGVDAGMVSRKIVDQLFWRLEHPEFPYETVYLSTKVILR